MKSNSNKENIKLPLNKRLRFDFDKMGKEINMGRFFQNPNLLKGKLLMPLVLILFSSFVTFVFLSPRAKTIKTKVFISSGGLGGVSAAIELSDRKIDFVMIEETDWLGGQATSQGVSTFDQLGNQKFYFSRVYKEITDAMRNEYGNFLGTATTGPGAPPEIIHNFFEKRIDKKYGKVLYETVLEDVKVNKNKNKIEYVIVKNLKSGEKTKIIAEIYLDSSDFADLSQKAGVPVRFGLDTQEETGESTALTKEEKDMFVKGFTYIKKSEEKSSNTEKKEEFVIPKSFLDENGLGVCYINSVSYKKEGWEAYSPCFLQEKEEFPKYTKSELEDLKKKLESKINDDQQTIKGEEVFVDGFGERIQPITVPFAVLDKGYFGEKKNLMKLFPDSEFSDCREIGIKDCLVIKRGGSIRSEILFPSRSNFDLYLGLKTENPYTLSIKIGGEVYQPDRLSKMSNFSSFSRTLYLKIPFQVKGQKLKFPIEIQNISNSDLIISELIIAESSKNIPYPFENLASLEKKSVRVLEFSDFEKKSGDWKEGKIPEEMVFSRKYFFSGPNSKIEAKLDGKNFDFKDEYLLVLTFPDLHTNTNKARVKVLEGEKVISEALVNQRLGIFPNFFPVGKIRFNPFEEYKIEISNESDKNLVFSSIFIVQSKNVYDFLIFQDGSHHVFSRFDSFDVFYSGKNSGSKMEIFNGTEKTPRLVLTAKEEKENQFVGRVDINSGNTVKISIPKDERDSSFFTLKRLSRYHYNSFVINSFSSDQTSYTIDFLETGNFDVFALFEKENIKKDEFISDILIKSNKAIVSSIKNARIRNGNLTRIAELNSKEGMVDVEISFLESKCSECLEKTKIIIRESSPENYNPILFQELFSSKDRLKPPGRKLLENETENKITFMNFRRILDPKNFRNEFGFETIGKISGVNSFGVSQVNLSNDFSFENIDLTRYRTDFPYRREVYEKAKNLSRNYYFWLKYDQPDWLLGCSKDEVFCSGKRISIFPKIMGTEDGYSKSSYIREVVRPEGIKTLTMKDISVLENLCVTKDSDEKKCTEIDILGNKFSIERNFATFYPSKSISSFFYPTDHHGYLNNFSDYTRIKKWSFRSSLKEYSGSDDLFKRFFTINGLWHEEARPSTIQIEHITPKSIQNLLFCGKNISVTNLANGSTRLHPAESAIGQSCGVITDFILKNKFLDVNQIAEEKYIREIQKELVKSKIYIIPLSDPEIEKWFIEGKTDLVSSMFFSNLDRILRLEVENQNSLKILPDKYVLFSELEKVFKDKNIDESNQEATFNDTEKVIDKKEYENFVKYASEYRCKKENKDCLGDPVLINPTEKIKRGDLAYFYYKTRIDN